MKLEASSYHLQVTMRCPHYLLPKDPCWHLCTSPGSHGTPPGAPGSCTLSSSFLPLLCFIPTRVRFSKGIPSQNRTREMNVFCFKILTLQTSLLQVCLEHKGCFPCTRTGPVETCTHPRRENIVNTFYDNDELRMTLKHVKTHYDSISRLCWYPSVCDLQS